MGGPKSDERNRISLLTVLALVAQLWRCFKLPFQFCFCLMVPADREPGSLLGGMLLSLHSS